MDKFSIDAGGEQEFTVRATVTASNFTETAKEKIVAAGGKFEVM